MIFRVKSEIFLHVTVFASCFTKGKLKCDNDFNCPEGCDVQFSGPCPESCSCPTAADCPDIPCPAPPPICIIYTKHNGCQSCACQAPFVVVEPKAVVSRTSKTFSTTSASKTEAATTTTRRNEFIQPVFTESTSSTIVEPFKPPVAVPSKESFSPAVAVVPKESFTPPVALPPKVSPTADESGGCNAEMQKEIDANFGALYSEIKDKSRSVTLMFPAIFEFSKSQLADQCRSYKSSLSLLSFEARRKCFTNYELYDTTYGTYSYACGYGTEMYFSRYFECLAGLKNDPKIISCDSPLSNNGQDQSLDSDSMCSTYDSLLNCIYESVVRKCGYDGWEIEYQFLSSVVRRLSRNCNLHRINITLNLRQSAKIS